MHNPWDELYTMPFSPITLIMSCTYIEIDERTKTLGFALTQKPVSGDGEAKQKYKGIQLGKLR